MIGGVLTSTLLTLLVSRPSTRRSPPPRLVRGEAAAGGPGAGRPAPSPAGGVARGSSVTRRRPCGDRDGSSSAFTFVVSWNASATQQLVVEVPRCTEGDLGPGSQGATSQIPASSGARSNVGVEPPGLISLLFTTSRSSTPRSTARTRGRRSGSTNRWVSRLVDAVTPAAERCGRGRGRRPATWSTRGCQL